MVSSDGVSVPDAWKIYKGLHLILSIAIGAQIKEDGQTNNSLPISMITRQINNVMLIPLCGPMQCYMFNIKKEEKERVCNVGQSDKAILEALTLEINLS